MPVRILQHNLGRGRTATSELRTMATRHRADILLIQEPWVNTGRVCGLGTTSNKILVCTQVETPFACIVILDPKMDVLLLSALSTKHCVFAQVTTATGVFYVVTLYLPPSEPLEPFLPQLRRLALRLGHAPTVIGEDLNAT